MRRRKVRKAKKVVLRKATPGKYFLESLWRMIKEVMTPIKPPIIPVRIAKSPTPKVSSPRGPRR